MSSTTSDPVLPPPVLQEVADGVFAYVQPDGTWWVNNTGLLLGRRGAAIVDTCSTEKRTRAFRDTIAAVTDQPVRTLVNTHHHGDHTHGNWLFGGATVVGHEATREGVLAAGVPGDQPFWTPFEIGEVVLEPPFLTYTDGVTLWVDDRRVEVTHVGTPAHTTNDSVVWLPEQKTLFAGDLLFAGGTPFLVMGSLAGAIEVLEQVVTPLGAETIETEISVHALELKMPVGEVATAYGARPEGSASKLSTYRDGWRILKTIGTLYRVERPVLFYGSVGAAILVAALLLAIPLVLTYLDTGLVPRVPTAILITGMAIIAVLCFFAGLILDTVTRGRREVRRLAYLAHRAPGV